jgi:hypothetical protein
MRFDCPNMAKAAGACRVAAIRGVPKQRAKGDFPTGFPVIPKLALKK